MKSNRHTMSVYFKNDNDEYDEFHRTSCTSFIPVVHIFGLGVYISKPYLSTLYNVTVWCAYSYLFYYTVSAVNAEKWFLASSTLICNGINLLVCITSIIMSLRQYKRLRKFIKRLAAVDDTLEELGTLKIYRKLHIHIKRTLIGWLVYTQMINISDMTWFCNNIGGEWCTIMPFITNHIQNANIFVDLVFTTCLWYIGTRFDKLNEHMRYLLLREEHGVKYMHREIVVLTHRSITCINNLKRVFWIIIHLHLELCQLAREINAIFEIQITILTIAYLIYVTRDIRYMFIRITSKDDFISLVDWINIIIWLFYYATRIFYLNYVIENVNVKSNEMNTIIRRLTDVSQYVGIHNEIYQFTLQIIHHPLKLSGLGFFDYGNDFLRKITVTIVTILIIIIQMPGASKSFKGF